MNTRPGDKFAFKTHDSARLPREGEAELGDDSAEELLGPLDVGVDPEAGHPLHQALEVGGVGPAAAAAGALRAVLRTRVEVRHLVGRKVGVNRDVLND